MRGTLAPALFAFACVAAAQVPMQQMPPDNNFIAVVAGEINAVANFTPPDFTLALRQEEQHFAFYGKEPGRLEGVRCERQAAFEFVALANLTGHIQAGICMSDAKRVRTLAASAPRAMESALAPLGLDMEQRRKAGLTATRSEGAHRTEEFTFPVIAFGHGVAAAQTVVIASLGRRAIIVQAETSKLCENYGLKDKTALCRDTRQALVEIARRLDARFARE